jgi:predicted GNAT family N-acyltransferase
MEVKQITAQQTITLRHRILRPHQTEADCIYPGDEATDSYHYGAFDGQKLVCIASVFKQSEERFGQFKQRNQYRLRGMATLTEYRGTGQGNSVLQACIAQCKAQGGELFWCNARTSAAGYYEKMGFASLPEEFDLSGIGPHRVMYIVP